MSPSRRTLLGTLGILLAVALVPAGIAWVGTRDAPIGQGVWSPPAIPSASTRASQPAAAASIRTAEGPEFDLEATSEPSALKVQSKLWHHDGRWWGILLSQANEFTIHVLDWRSQAWHDTGVPVDERPGSRADALSDGDVLTVVSAGRREDSASHGLRISQFLYDREAAMYALDAGFPAQITDHGVQGPNVAIDSGGRLWVAFVHDQLVKVTTSGDGFAWVPAFELPTDGTDVSDDLAAIVAHGGRVGIIWTNQLQDAVYFAEHDDDEPVDQWSSTRVLVEGLAGADDHINVKALDGPDGGIFAVVKTSLNDLVPRNNAKPLIVLLAFRGADDWRQSVVATVGERFTRPALAIDEDRGELYVFAGVRVGTRSDIHYKRARIEDLRFSGQAEALLSDPDGELRNPTTTKQPVGNSTGLVVIAADKDSGHYAHAAMSLGEQEPDLRPFRAPQPSRQITVFSETFQGGEADTTVRHFWDVSGGPPEALSYAETDAGLVASIASGTEATRACRDFSRGASDRVHAAARVQLDRLAGTALILTLRGQGSDAAALRVGPNGNFIYLDGANSIRTAFYVSAGTWYDVSIEADLKAGGYEWAIAGPGGRLDGTASLATADAPPDKLCFRSPAGGVRLMLDDVVLAR